MPSIWDTHAWANNQLATPNQSFGWSSQATTASSGSYANDTHFYSNVGGSIVLMK